MSRSRARWTFRGEKRPELSPAAIKAAGDSRLLARLLVNRGLDDGDAIRRFLSLEEYIPCDPAELPDLDIAVQRLRGAIEAKEPILVFGDFDVDGQTGTAIFTDALTQLGANFSSYIPDRAAEGHGLNATALCRLVSARKVKLIVTTDTGVTNFSEVSLMRGLGVDVIITDHHDLPEHLPPALAVVNPKRLEDSQHPCYALCGAGVAYKVCLALLDSYGQADFADSLLDLAALGTVVDMMPLLEENRWLVWRGLRTMNARRRPGLAAILSQAGAPAESEITSETLGFTIGPRLNAVGRLERADDAVELLTSQDEDRCRVIAAHFEALNRKRQELCEQTVLDAERYVVSHGALDGQRALILANADWHPGIIGLAATRLKERFNVPVFLIIPDAAKGEARCSARSIDGFPLMERLSTLQDYFLHAGGHAGAGGFALPLERLDAFRRDLHALASRHITDEMMRPTLELDDQLDWAGLTPGLVDLINRMRPFGQGNPAPLFALTQVAIVGQKPLGESGDHLKLILAPADEANRARAERLEGIIWGFGRTGTGQRLDDRALWSLAVAPEQNVWRGQTRLQLIIKDYAADVQTPSSVHGAMASVSPSPSEAPKPVIAYEQAVATFSRPQTPNAHNAAIWIDHRSREGVDAFVGQLMLPLQDSRSVALYHEGRPLQIPFVESAIVCSRQTLGAAQELILWDLPPDPATFRRVMEKIQPTTIHLVGGKYQSTPVFPPARDLIRLVAMAVRHLAAEAPEDAAVVLSAEELAWRLAATPAVILSAAAVLVEQGLATVDAERSHPPQTLALRPTSALMALEIPENEALGQSLAFHSLRHLQSQVSRYRDWLLRAPLDAIQIAWPLMPDLFSPVAPELAQTVATTARPS